MKLNRTTPIVFLVPCLAFLVLGRALAAQSAARNPPVSKDEAIEMSPFSVNTSRDVGYQAENTLAAAA